MSANNFSGILNTRGLLLMVAIPLFLYFGKGLLIPMSYGLFIAIILYPLCRWLEIHKWPRSLAITLCLLIIVILFIALISILIIQINLFRKDLPLLSQKLQPAIAASQEWIQNIFGTAASSQQGWWQNILQQISNNAGNIANTSCQSLPTAYLRYLLYLFTVLYFFTTGKLLYNLQRC